MCNLISQQINISGAVQGVGFRPFIYTIAQQLGIVGEVYNDASGVIIMAQGTAQQFTQFLSMLSSDAPALSNISHISSKDAQMKHYLTFSISRSRGGKVATQVLPDASICADCIKDITDKNNRRYGYAFTNCTHCGPRFSILKNLPYDRKSTSMARFNLCQQCQQEYQNPDDRRFHAQPNACPDCGPQLQLTDSAGNTIASDQLIKHSATLLKQGKIIAIKGIGGFHLACLATNDSAITTLRKRKHRAHKPFALMAKDLNMIRRYCQISPAESALLLSSAAPIVLLACNPDATPLPPSIAPQQNKLGFMLPYSPLHYLLLQQFDVPLLLTSGNPAHHPQITDNQQALQKLSQIADYFLLHNRDIINRVDDSIVQICADRPHLIRRARGYAPTVLPLPNGFKKAQGLLAVGAELNNTFCLLSQTEAVISQHIGDLTSLQNYQDFSHNITLYQHLYASPIQRLVCDFHPDYLSSKYADRTQTDTTPLSQIQHHHAHIAACLFEHNRAIDSAKVLGVVWDGMGLGADKQLWGGEFLLADYLGFKRLAHFEYTPLLGADHAQTQPWRMAYAHLTQHDLATKAYFHQHPTDQLDNLLTSNFIQHSTSSVGRLFDAVAYLLDICPEYISYEAQAAIELEALASQCHTVDAQPTYKFDLKPAQQHSHICCKNFWIALLADLDNHVKREDIAYRFHLSLAQLLLDTALQLKQTHAFDTVVLSGGVFHNQLLITLLSDLFAATDLSLLTHSTLPCGDGSISLGQAAIDLAREQKYG